MQLYNATNKEISLYHDTLGLLGIPEDNTTTLPFSTTFLRYANAKYLDLAYLAWKHDQNWDFHDANSENLPEAYTDLIAGKNDYSLPTTIFDIREVFAKNSRGDYERLKMIDESELNGDPDEIFETDGMPRYYKLKGFSIILYPTPSATKITESNGLKIFFTETPTLFTSSSTNTEPGVPPFLHRYISVGVALDFAMSMDMTNKIAMLNVMMQQETQKVIDYFSNRGKEKKVKLNIKNKIKI